MFGLNPPTAAVANAKMIGAQQQAAHEADLAHLTIQQIAADTGGKAFVNTNGFQEAIRQALADGANYCSTLGYMPQLEGTTAVSAASRSMSMVATSLRIAMAIMPTARGAGQIVALAR